MYYVRLLRGLKEPNLTSQQLIKAEKITGFWKKGLWLLFITLIVSALTAYLGIGNELVSKELNSLSSTGFEATKSLFAAGRVTWSIIAIHTHHDHSILIFLDGFGHRMEEIYHYAVFRCNDFLIEKVILIPFTIFMGLPDLSNPFSLGIIGQYLTSNDIILQFLCSSRSSKSGLWSCNTNT